MNPLEGKNVENNLNGFLLQSSSVGKTTDGKKVTVKEKNDLQNIDQDLISLEESRGSLDAHRIHYASRTSNTLFSRFIRLFQKVKKSDLENIDDKIIKNQNKIDSHIQNLKRIFPNENVDELVNLIKESVFLKKIKTEAIKGLIEPQFTASKEVIQILKKLIPLLLENRELIDDSEGLESIASIHSESSMEDSESSVDSLELERGFSESEEMSIRSSRSGSLSSKKNEEPIRSQRIVDQEPVNEEANSDDEYFPFTKDWFEKNK